MDAGRRACIDYLVERGARHHIFSAMCVGDLPLIQAVVEQNPDALERRMSRFERGLTPLLFAIRRRRHVILSLLLGGLGRYRSSQAHVPHVRKVAVLFLENHGYDQIIGSPQAPYLNRLANRGALATDYYAIGHPSLPNYLALTTGSTQGVTSDCNSCENTARSLLSGRGSKPRPSA